jgi:hypothetical protein
MQLTMMAVDAVDVGGWEMIAAVLLACSAQRQTAREGQGSEL